MAGVPQRHPEPEQTHDRRPDRTVCHRSNRHVLQPEDERHHLFIQEDHKRTLRRVLRKPDDSKGAYVLQGLF